MTERGIRQHKSGRWEVRVTDPTTGRRVSRYADSQAQAVRVRDAMIGRTQSGATVADTRDSLRAYAAVWLEQRAGRRRSASTVREYRRRLEAYVLPRVGGIRVSALTVLDVEDVLDDLAAAGLSESTIRGTRNALAAMLSDAVRARQLATNVAAAARLPEVVASPAARVVPTPDDVVRLVDETAGTDLGALIALLACTGARVGEALAAMWPDVDLDAGTWLVGRTVTRSLTGAPVLGSRTKTGDTRTVVLSADALEALREQRTRVAAARLSLGAAWTDMNLVFPTTVGTVREPNNVRTELRKAAPWFPGSFHGLRHAFATAAVSVLPSDTAVAKVLGHRKRATTTDLYAHLRADDSRAVADVVAAQLAAARGRR